MVGGPPRSFGVRRMFKASSHGLSCPSIWVHPLGLVPHNDFLAAGRPAPFQSDRKLGADIPRPLGHEPSLHGEVSNVLSAVVGYYALAGKSSDPLLWAARRDRARVGIQDWRGERLQPGLQVGTHRQEHPHLSALVPGSHSRQFGGHINRGGFIAPNLPSLTGLAPRVRQPEASYVRKRAA